MAYLQVVPQLWQLEQRRQVGHVRIRIASSQGENRLVLRLYLPNLQSTAGSTRPQMSDSGRNARRRRGRRAHQLGYQCTAITASLAVSIGRT